MNVSDRYYKQYEQLSRLRLGMVSKHGVGVCYVYMCLFQMLSRLKLLLCFCARVVYCVACSQCAFGRRSYSTG